ncbi:GDP-mannose 4,6-dehydratase [Sphingomonas sp. CARO-RG-8B-R24-01]|uniref:GDP-mannose 4,6-dehydratase n=1 Tax=Sphingomonas sp. CARO-RG-8B-R24-01 TaxID=2914831 RepID=UPI001F58FA7E|nr:GDP-mannose 4,6-dehydratase [Sphingomonas sp. CARO-RG-8B-R24-01]
MSKVALITGVTGQDGAYLARLLIDQGYAVHGIIRRSSAPNVHRLSKLLGGDMANGRLKLHYGDITDFSSMVRIIAQVRPTEIYNLAAQSHVAVSFETPEYTANADGIGVLRLLEAIRTAGLNDHARFYQASTSELYGKVQETPQTETTPFHPRSPYGVAKLYGYWITVNYREAYGMHASNGILFNHEGQLRGELFVTRKISKTVAQIKAGHKQTLRLGNLEARRDWGDARDYVRGMHLILQQEEPDDYVLATGEMHSVREFVEVAFGHIDRTIRWEGEGVDEVGLCATTGEMLVMVDPEYFRPAEVDLLLGDPTKAQTKLGWKHERNFEQLVTDMVSADVDRQQRISDSRMVLEDFL